MTASSNDYRLPRDDAESSRLNSQHNIHKASLGYLLHPIIISALTHPDATSQNTTTHIADLGTGTGVFLQDLLTTLPENQSRHPLTGFDISSDQFPSNLPPQITLLEQDTLKPFPTEHQGKYTAVHARLIGQAFPTEKWAFVVQNVLSIVKPGGYVQWIEPDHVRDAGLVYLAGHESGDRPKTQAWEKAVDFSMRREEDLQWNRETLFARDLAKMMSEAKSEHGTALTDAVREEIVPIDFAPSVRGESMRNSLKMFGDGLSDFVEQGKEDQEMGIKSQEDVKSLVEVLEEEMKSWEGKVVYRYFLRVVVAKRAMA